MQGTNRESLEERGACSGSWWRLRRRIKGAMHERTWGQPSFRIVIPSTALDLYCPAGICVYAPRENDVLVLSHIRQ